MPPGLHRPGALGAFQLLQVLGSRQVGLRSVAEVAKGWSLDAGEIFFQGLKVTMEFMLRDNNDMVGLCMLMLIMVYVDNGLC